ncbi:galactose mutarotase [Devosia sp. Root685]|uniref:aldose epimerase family protein n=1 Tax=Devosia sp. Root685 TaxID=1736587 RepID=UPI0006F2862B|nr:aldose epimerase family protein [Devosia sp. Root685]KRA99487.1 galactose mutarotase [Devosia sp. Root685]
MSHSTILKIVLGNIDGQAVEAYRLSAGGTSIEVMTFGAILTRLTRPDRTGKIDDIVLGYDDPADYVTKPGNSGAICGRHSNRMADGRFVLDGRPYDLPRNNGAHHLHGGMPGFGKRFWSAHPHPENNSVEFRLHSPDGDQGYPGALDASTTYRLSEEGTLSITMRATSDRTTVVNLIYHGYWNLGGHRSGSVEGQMLRIAADRYTPVTPDKIPTGEIVAVAGTPFDFTTAKPIGRDIAAAWPGGGYDHNLCHTDFDGTMRLSAEAHDPASGRALSIRSNQPGVQLYTANHFADAPTPGKGGALYQRYAGFALETQNFPNAPNVPAFPSSVLRPGEIYEHRMDIAFSTVAL